MATITEDYVSFEIAKLLKEKGFEGFTLFSYSNRGSTMCGHWENEIDWLPKCTLQMAMKWLREKHNLVVNPVTTSVGVRDYGEWEADIYYRDSGIDATVNACGHIYGKTYEEACDAGIRYCLEHII